MKHEVLCQLTAELPEGALVGNLRLNEVSADKVTEWSVCLDWSVLRLVHAASDPVPAVSLIFSGLRVV
jgi:hypothetical protein